MSAAITAAVVAGAGAAAMANQQEIAGRHALADQQAMQEEGMNAQERMFEKSLEIMEPYRDAGYGALTGLQALVDPGQRAQQLTDYYASDEYKALQNQASADVMRAQSAQGGLRGGSTYQQLENVAPQLGQNYLTNQYNQLTGLANMGMGAASQGASGYNQLGTSQLNMYNQMGANTAAQQIAAANSQASAINSGLSGLGAAFGGYFGGTV